MKISNIKRLTLSALCVALCVVLPMAFHVIPNAGASFDAAMDALFAGYTDIEVDGEYVYGHDDAYRYYRAARLIKTQDGILAATWRYTVEAAEGFGARLRVLAATLQPTD